MKSVFNLLCLAFVFGFFAAAPATAQNIRTERVSFAAGSSGSVVQNRISGDQIVDYVLNAGGGQRMVIDMSTNNPSAYFNLIPSGSPSAIHVGSTAGLHYDGILPSSGDWVIRVYLMRNAARRGESANYTLSVHIGGAAASRPTSDFADAQAGGPDYWQVTGTQTLNIRSGPSTDYAVTGRAAYGQVFRNLGCRGGGSGRWCHIETANGLQAGWVAGRYLRESGAPIAPGAPQPGYAPPESAAMGPDFWEVYRVPPGDMLNIRGGPSTRYSIVARAPNGERLRNLGCQGHGDARWCHVQTPDGRHDGWASGAYLREGGAPPSGGSASINIPSGSPIAPDLRYRPTGEIEAAWSSGCTVLYNPAGRRINAGASCSQAQLIASDLWVARTHR